MKIEDLLMFGGLALGGLYLVGKLNLGKSIGSGIADVGVGIAQGAVGAVHGATESIWSAGASYGNDAAKRTLDWLAGMGISWYNGPRVNPGPHLPTLPLPVIGSYGGQLLTFR